MNEPVWVMDRSRQDDLWARIIKKLERTSSRVGASFPHVSIDGRYALESIDWWTNGFWPGILWLAWHESGNSTFAQLAISCEAQLDRALEEFLGLHHDVGFMWMPSAVADYKITGSREAYRRAMHAATLLAGRFNPKAGIIRSWGTDRADPETVGWVIVDSLMNLGLLYWASLATGDPAFRAIATIHADTVLREFVREDGATHHIVCFDPNSGRVVETRGGQGFAPESAWSRGNAWAL